MTTLRHSEAAFETVIEQHLVAHGPPGLRRVERSQNERYVTCIPLVPLKAAAGAFSDPQHVEDDGFEWVAVESHRRLGRGMFIAQVIGKSMEPGRRLVSLSRSSRRHATGQDGPHRAARWCRSGDGAALYRQACYASEKSSDGDTWEHERILLKPTNPDFDPIILTNADRSELRVIAEMIEVIAP